MAPETLQLDLVQEELNRESKTLDNYYILRAESGIPIAVFNPGFHWRPVGGRLAGPKALEKSSPTLQLRRKNVLARAMDRCRISWYLPPLSKRRRPENAPDWCITHPGKVFAHI